MSEETTTQSAIVSAPPDVSMARSDGLVNEAKEAGVALITKDAVNETLATTEIQGIYDAH